MSSIGIERIEGGVIDSVLTFAVVKTNYAKRPLPLDLRYDDGGVLVPLDDTARQIADVAREEFDPRARRERKRGEAKANRDAEIDAAVVLCVKTTPGIGASDLRNHVKARAGCGPDAADTAITRMIQARRVSRTEGKTKQHYIVEDSSNGDAGHTGAANGATSAAYLDPLDCL